ncbi:MAG: hypothetical protein WA151_24110 [Desulfatirhabdiaceae bacterium]
MSKKILIADVPAEIRKLVLTLQSDDHQILEARNGADTAAITRTIKPDLIIMDIMS